MKKLILIPVVLFMLACVNGNSEAQQNYKMKNAELISVVEGIRIYKIRSGTTAIYMTVSSSQGLTSSISIR